MHSYRVFPDLDNHVAEYYARFGVRFAKAVRWPKSRNWHESGLVAMWALILAWQAVRLACGGGR